MIGSMIDGLEKIVTDLVQNDLEEILLKHFIIHKELS